MNVEMVVNGRMSLGEGLHWDDARKVLWGVDIHGRMVWRWDLESAEPDTWTLDQRVGWILPMVAGDSLLLGLQGGVARAPYPCPASHAWVVRPFEGNDSLRLNDAKADASGAVWAGSLNNDDESRSDGCLFRLGVDGRLNVMDVGYQVANGPAINAAGTFMLHTDSGRRTIYGFDLDVDSGTLANKRTWKVFSESEGYPDGMCFDAEGCVWVAHWGAGCVSRFAPDGALLARIALPVSQVTNVCFGGVGLNRLFVSSARVGLSVQELIGQPLAGGVFEVTGVGVRGLPSLPSGLK